MRTTYMRVPNCLGHNPRCRGRACSTLPTIRTNFCSLAEGSSMLEHLSTRRFLPAIAFITLATGLAIAQDNALTGKESAAGWKLVFDGKSITGWKLHVGGG